MADGFTVFSTSGGAQSSFAIYSHGLHTCGRLMGTGAVCVGGLGKLCTRWRKGSHKVHAGGVSHVLGGRVGPILVRVGGPYPRWVAVV